MEEENTCGCVDCDGSCRDEELQAFINVLCTDFIPSISNSVDTTKHGVQILLPMTFEQLKRHEGLSVAGGRRIDLDEIVKYSPHVQDRICAARSTGKLVVVLTSSDGRQILWFMEEGPPPAEEIQLNSKGGSA